MDFEAKLEAFYNQLDLDGTTIIDIGAHIGRHAIPLAKKIGPAGLLYAFEPIPLIRNRLNENIYASGLNNVVVLPFALSTKREVADFTYVPNLPEESGLKERRIYNDIPSEFQKIKVGVFQLDDLIPLGSKVSFLKIDVEGGELDVFLGASNLLESTRPIVAFECGAASFLGYHEAPDRIFDIFDALGYQIFAITGERILTKEIFSKATYAQNFWDYIAFPFGKEELAGLLKNA
jgi:FkbM family methyltransferase